VSDTRVRVRAT